MTDRADEIRARLSAATEGPWIRAWGDDPERVAVKTLAHYEVGRYIAVLDDSEGNKQADAALIAHAPSDIAWLLEERERLETALKKIGVRAQRCLMDGHTMQADADDIARVTQVALKEVPPR